MQPDPEFTKFLYGMAIGGGIGIAVGAVSVIMVVAWWHDRRLRKGPPLLDRTEEYEDHLAE